VSIEAVMQGMMRTQWMCDGIFDAVCFCRHYPTADDPEKAQCWCRKPKIGMLIDATRMIERKYDCVCPPHLALFVGDRTEDQECAANAGIDFMWAQEWRDTVPDISTIKLPYERYDE